jgi:hypothetical protein
MVRRPDLEVLDRILYAAIDVSGGRDLGSLVYGDILRQIFPPSTGLTEEHIEKRVIELGLMEASYFKEFAD